MIIIHPRIFSIFAFTVFAMCGVKLGVTVMLECEPSLEVPCNAKHSRDTESPSPHSPTVRNWMELATIGSLDPLATSSVSFCVNTFLNTSPRCNPDLGGTGPRRPRLSAFRVTLSWLHLKLQRPPEVIGAQENVSVGEHPNFHQVFHVFHGVSWCPILSLSSTRELVTSQKPPRIQSRQRGASGSSCSCRIAPGRTWNRALGVLESKWRRTSHETQDYRTIGPKWTSRIWCLGLKPCNFGGHNLQPILFDVICNFSSCS